MSPARHVALILGVATVYYLAAKCGLQLALVRGQVTPLWPPTGIAVFAMLVFGYRVWPGVVIGALAVNGPIGPSVLAVCLITSGNTLAPMTSVGLLRWFDFHLDLSRLRDAVALVFPGALVGMVVSATIGTTALVTNGAVSTSRFWSTWTVWWTGDAMGVLVFTPLLLAVRLALSEAAPNPARVLEGVGLVVASAAVSIIVFSSTIPISFLILPLLVYAALRFQLVGTAPAIAVVCVIAVVAGANSWGLLAHEDVLHKMLSLQAFNGVVSLTALFLSAMATERNTNRRLMETATERLHESVRTRTEELATAVERLERANAAKSEFLSRMSHELRTPLNAIIGFSSLLMYEDLNTKHREMLEMIDGGGRHLLELINDVLDISRIEAGNMTFKAEEVVLVDVVQDAQRLIELLCQDMKVSVSVDVDPTHVAVADNTRLRQVMLNLLSNAAKYNKPGGSITISSRAGGDTVRIAVADTGVGFEQSLLGELFTPFARLGAEFSKIEGTGLGLTVSRAIVDEMGGSIALESTGPSGSVFVVSLKGRKRVAAADSV